jgi:hypothetical protein
MASGAAETSRLLKKVLGKFALGRIILALFAASFSAGLLVIVYFKWKNIRNVCRNFLNGPTPRFLRWMGRMYEELQRMIYSTGG